MDGVLRISETQEPACVQCWCDGYIVKATQFVVFRWLCDKHLNAITAG